MAIAPALLHLADDDGEAARLAIARSVAPRFKAALESVHAEPPAEMSAAVMGWGAYP